MHNMLFKQCTGNAWWSTLLLLVMIISMTACVKTTPPEKNARAAELNVRLGVNYLQSGNFKLANRKLKKALAQNPRSSLVQWTNALLEEKLDHPEEAESHYKKAVKLNRNDSEAYNNYGAFLCRQQRVDEALQAFESAVNNPLYSTKDYAYTNAGICLNEQGRKDEAKAYFLKALEIHPPSASANYQLALLYYEQGGYRQSSLIRERIRGEAANTAHVLWLCAVTERQLGNNNRAGSCSKKLLHLYPASKEADKLNAGLS